MLKIGNVSIRKGKTVIIAEAGVNHNGKMHFAKKLVDEAKKAGADIIKFQTYKASNLTTQKAPRFWNWKNERIKNGSQFDSYSNLDSFEKKQFEEIIKYCKKKKIEFMSTAFDEFSADMLVSIGMKAFKIASCDITNTHLIEHIAKKKLPILLSTGASNIKEIENAVNLIRKKKNNKIIIMHCTLCYPTNAKNANLTAINHLKKKFPNYLIGLSDHTLGIEVPSAAPLLGVEVIEKHFTFNKKLKKSADHWLSVNGPELKRLVENVKIINDARGNNKKIVLPCEIKARNFARRSIVANHRIYKNQKIEMKDLRFKRPGTGIAPNKIGVILGKYSKKNFNKDHIFKISDFKNK
jgi:sialic acid synthase SpsE